MPANHNIVDSDYAFVVNATTRNITRQSGSNKSYLMQYDHNSERFTFQVPRYIESHDMSDCDLIQIHYENSSNGTSASARKTYRGIHKIYKNDITTNEDDTISFSWLIPETATMYAGVLKFQLKFICYHQNGKWQTVADVPISDESAFIELLELPTTDIDTTKIYKIPSFIEIIKVTDDGVESAPPRDGLELIYVETKPTSGIKETTSGDDAKTYVYYVKEDNNLFVYVEGEWYTTSAIDENFTFRGTLSEMDDTSSLTEKGWHALIENTYCQYVHVIDYRWHSNVNSEITINAGLPYSADEISPSATAMLHSLEIEELESGVKIILDGKEYTVGTITTTIDENSTDDQFVSAKAVYDLVNTTVGDVLTTDVEG